MTLPFGNRVANVDGGDIFSKCSTQKNFAFLSLFEVLLRSQGLISFQSTQTKLQARKFSLTKPQSFHPSKPHGPSNKPSSFVQPDRDSRPSPDPNACSCAPPHHSW